MRTKFLLSLAAMACAVLASAQTKATKIESPIVSEKDFVWYVEQKEAWKAETQKDATSETAWLNYYNAARYMSVPIGNRYRGKAMATPRLMQRLH